MIGEMHGTNEPANFLIGLAELFANYGDTVQVGFEIPGEQMTNYFQTLTDSNVSQSDFFTNNSADGRASVAWANAITRLAKNSQVQIFFYGDVVLMPTRGKSRRRYLKLISTT